MRFVLDFPGFMPRCLHRVILDRYISSYRYRPWIILEVVLWLVLLLATGANYRRLFPLTS